MRVDVLERTRALICDWNIIVEETKETETSILSFGKRREQPVVLKVLRNPGDEWRCGEVLQAFNGRGSVQVYEYVEGAVLLERIVPAGSLVNLVLSGQDEEATGILAGVIVRMGSPPPPAGCVAIEDWARGFDRYLQTANEQISKNLVKQARDSYLKLCGSQRHQRLLHGDLHHDNVLFDANRGWLSVDPKGVVGEIEYEIGAALRNPIGRPDLFASRDIVHRRIERFGSELGLDCGRALQWSFAQAVLSAVWEWEDGFAINDAHPTLQLAREMRSMLGERSGVE